MSVVPQITCSQCGAQYSALRSRCPNCGTRHVKQTVRATPTTDSVHPETTAGAHANANTQWQMIFGGVLVMAVIVAVIILINASLNAVEPVNALPSASPSSLLDGYADPTEPVYTEPLIQTEPPTPTSSVTSVGISYGGSPLLDFTQRTTWQAITITASVYPTEALIDNPVEWRSSNDSVCTVTKTGDTTATVTAVGPGNCEIILSCGGMEAKATAYVPN